MLTNFNRVTTAANQLQMNQEIEDLKTQVSDYQKGYIRKEWLCQILDKLQQAFEVIELDASSLQEVIQNLYSEHPSQIGSIPSHLTA